MKLRQLKRKILPSRRLFQRRGISHQSLCTRVLHHGVIDHRREVESTEEDLLEDTQGRDELVLRLGEEGFQDLLEGITDTLYPEAGVGQGTIVTGRDADHHLFPGVVGLIREGDQDHPEGKGTDEKDLENVVEVAAGLGVDLDDPPWAILR